jgi:hypothetical protein
MSVATAVRHQKRDTAAGCAATRQKYDRAFAASLAASRAVLNAIERGASSEELWDLQFAADAAEGAVQCAIIDRTAAALLHEFPAMSTALLDCLARANGLSLSEIYDGVRMDQPQRRRCHTVE